MTQQSRAPRKWSRGRIAGCLIALGVIGTFIGANAHLLSVSFASQPDCVAHLKTATEGASQYRAAKSSC